MKVQQLKKRRRVGPSRPRREAQVNAGVVQKGTSALARRHGL